MSVSLENSEFKSHNTFRITGLSKLKFNGNDIFGAQLAGSWNITFIVPSKEKKHLEAFIYPPQNHGAYLNNHFLELSIQSLGGDIIFSHSVDWDTSTAAKEITLMSWDALWTDNATTQRDDGFRVSVDISTDRSSTRPVVRDPFILHNLSQQIEGRDIIDTKFMLFSRRRIQDGIVGAQKPLAVYANSSLIESQCDYINTLLNSKNFCESDVVSLNKAPADEWIEHYDYESDSDLDYDSEDEDQGDEDHARNNRATKEAKPLKDLSKHTASQSANEPLSGRDSPPSSFRVGKVVAIKDTAYITWKALIFYLCTSQLSFAPLSSHSLSRSRTKVERLHGLPPSPSAKSMYRLADKLGLTDICERAMEHIDSQLSKDIIVRELFSSFTARYKNIRDMELAFLDENWKDIKDSPELKEKLAEVAQGSLPHATDILIRLVTR